MFGLPNTTAGHSPSPGTSFSALSTATSTPSSSSAPVIFGQSPHSSSVIVPSPGFPVTIFSQPQIPAISATCLEQNNPPNASSSSSSPSGATLTSLIAATLATSLAAQQQRNQQQQALSILNNAAAMAQQQQQQIAAAQNLFSEFFLLRSQQNAAPQLPPTMPLPFPNNCNPIQTAPDQPNSQSALLNSVQQQKTAIDIIQKALEAIAVANQQQQPPKLANGIGVSPPPPPSLLGANPSPANGVPSNLYVHLQQNGVALSQQPSTTAILQQQNAQLEQQLLALFANNQQQQSPPPNQQNGLLKANANLSASLFQPSAAPFQHPSNNNVQMNSISGNGEQPLDLSQRAALFESSSSLINIPSGGNHPSQQRKNCEIRRSASSVSYYKKSNADVSEHFQRTFSGKWPKRQPSFRHNPAIGGRASKSSIGTKEGSIGETVIEGESEGRDSPMDEGNRASAEPQKNVEVVQMVEEQQRPPSRPKSRLQHRLGYTLIKKIFTSSDDKQVEEHFRKSLGDDRFKQIRNAQQKQQQENNNVDKMEANSPQP